MRHGTDDNVDEGVGCLIWLVGGPSVGKSSVARALRRAGGADDCWVLAGDHHLLRVVPADQIVRYADRVDADWPWWSVPCVDGQLTGRPRAGQRAVRLLDGMYRAAVAMARAGNNVVVEDVVWEPMVATMARHVLAEVDPLVVRLVCPSSVAIDRERARPDRFVGGVAAYATAPEIVTDVDLSFDSSLRDPHQIAAGIRAAIDSRGTRPTSANNGR